VLAGATVAVAGLMFCAKFEAANSRIYLRMSEKGAGALPAISEQRSLVRNLRALKCSSGGAGFTASGSSSAARQIHSH
jgi:hypothetical protein